MKTLILGAVTTWLVIIVVCLFVLAFPRTGPEVDRNTLEKLPIGSWEPIDPCFSIRQYLQELETDREFIRQYRKKLETEKELLKQRYVILNSSEESICELYIWLNAENRSPADCFVKSGEAYSYDIVCKDISLKVANAKKLRTSIAIWESKILESEKQLDQTEKAIKDQINLLRADWQHYTHSILSKIAKKNRQRYLLREATNR